MSFVRYTVIKCPRGTYLLITYDNDVIDALDHDYLCHSCQRVCFSFHYMASKHVEKSTLSSPSDELLLPLYEACRDGDEKRVRLLLPKYSPADLNRQEASREGNTCLHIAAANGYDNIVKLLLKHGCYRSCILNNQNQSAYELAVNSGKESTRLSFLRQDETNSSLKSSSRFTESNPSNCFDIVQAADNQTPLEKPSSSERKSLVQTYRTEEEKEHELGYSASSKTMCQSRFGRFCVNRFHPDEPLDHQTILRRLTDLLEQDPMKTSDDYIKADDLMQQYTENCRSIEQLLHLYTLETKFYRILRQDCLPLAIPLFMNLSKLKNRYFQGLVYRGMRMSSEQLSTYQIAMETSGTFLQTTAFSSTSMNRSIAEQFAHSKSKSNEQNNLCVLFIFDFPVACDQAINLSRISSDTPCLSEYEDEQEVLILPWTLFRVTRVETAELCRIYLTNIAIPKKNLLATLKWTWVELKNQFGREKKIRMDCAFQKYAQPKSSHQ